MHLALALRGSAALGRIGERRRVAGERALADGVAERFAQDAMDDCADRKGTQETGRDNSEPGPDVKIPVIDGSQSSAEGGGGSETGVRP